MSSVTILTDDNEIVIIPRPRVSMSPITNIPVCAVEMPTTSIFVPPPTNNGHTKVFADGLMSLAEATTRADHVAVIDHATGLMWAVESIGDEDDDSQDHAARTKACADLRLLGYDDWRLPTRTELAALVDDTRRDPAIDTSLFPRVKPHWHWTSTETAWSSSSAWGVSFGSGGVYGCHRGSSGFALAVRRAGQ